MTARKDPKRAGQPTKYRQKYCKDIIKYFDVPHTLDREVTFTNKKGDEYTKTETYGNKLPFFEGFASKIKVTCQTVLNWTEQHTEFFEAYTRAKDLQLSMLASNTLAGYYNSHYAIFATKNLTQWRDKKDIEHSGKLDASVFFQKMLIKASALDDDPTIEIPRRVDTNALDLNTDKAAKVPGISAFDTNKDKDNKSQGQDNQDNKHKDTEKQRDDFSTGEGGGGSEGGGGPETLHCTSNKFPKPQSES